MKILQVPTGGMFLDGINSCIIEYMTEMDKTDTDIRVLAVNVAKENIIRNIEEAGCKVVSIPYRKKNVIKYFWELYKYILKEKIDIVHVHGSSALMSIELIAAKLAGCNIRIAHSHNIACKNVKVDKILRPIFDKSYTVSFACGYDAGKWMFGNHEFTIISNSRKLKKYEFDKNKRVNCRKELDIPENVLVIGHVGCFNTQKNHKYLIQIFSEILKRNENSYLVMIGEGNTFDETKKLVKDLALEKNVIFTGIIDSASDYLSAFDVMLLPSLYEGLPLVVIEWQIAGLPCIVSDTVTKECKITDLVQFESIEKEATVWADDVEMIVFQDRENIKEKIWMDIKQAGYDIEVEARKLKENYVDLLKM